MNSVEGDDVDRFTVDTRPSHDYHQPIVKGVVKSLSLKA